MQESESAPVSVLIVEDDRVTRLSLSLAIEKNPNLKVLAAFDSVRPALEWLETNSIDVLLTDLGLPDGSGLEIIAACAERYPECAILVLTLANDDDTIFSCIRAGALGYLLKDSSRLDIADTILRLRAGETPMSPEIARKVLAQIRVEKKVEATPENVIPTGEILTRRQTEVLELIARGNSYIEIAGLLFISVATLQNHIKTIYRKLSVHSRGEAVFEAQRRGYFRSDPGTTESSES